MDIAELYQFPVRADPLLEERFCFYCRMGLRHIHENPISKGIQELFSQIKVGDVLEIEKDGIRIIKQNDASK